MSCFKTSEAGFKALLRRKGLIDEYLNILDLGRFRAEVTQWSNYAYDKYGITERLFFEEQNGTKAVPNERAFQIIDYKKGVKYPENEWVGFPLNEMSEDYWRELYTRNDLSNVTDFREIDIPGIINKFKPDPFYVYHGTNIYEINSKGQLILEPSLNFEGKTQSISLTQVPVVAQDYMLRKNGRYIIKIKNSALKGYKYEVENSEEIAINTDKPFIINPGEYEIINVETIGDIVTKQYQNDISERARKKLLSEQSVFALLMQSYNDEYSARMQGEVDEYQGNWDKPSWYVSDEKRESLSSDLAQAGIEIDREWLIKSFALEYMKNEIEIGVDGRVYLPMEEESFYYSFGNNIIEDVLNDRFNIKKDTKEYREIINQIRQLVLSKYDAERGTYDIKELEQEVKLKDKQILQKRIALFKQANEYLYQTQSVSRNQITPEVKEQLLGFLRNVNPENEWVGTDVREPIEQILERNFITMDYYQSIKDRIDTFEKEKNLNNFVGVPFYISNAPESIKRKMGVLLDKDQVMPWGDTDISKSQGFVIVYEQDQFNLYTSSQFGMLQAWGVGSVNLKKMDITGDEMRELIKYADPGIDTQVRWTQLQKILSDQLYQTQSVSRNQITPEVREQLLTFLRNVNPDFRVEVIDDLSVNGLVNISEFLIQLKRGQENLALSEETAHVFVELLADQQLKKDLLGDVVRTKMYKWVLEEYKGVYNTPERFKREAAAKLISLYIQDREAFNYWSGSDELNKNLGSLITRLINWIKRHFKNPYSTAALRILKGSTDGIDLSLAKDSEVYYQLDPRYSEFETLDVKDITKFDKIFINLNNTLLDYKGYKAPDFSLPDRTIIGKNVKRLFFSDSKLAGELDRYYNDVKLTKFGRELKDKISQINPNRIIVFTDAPITDSLITRLEQEFGPVNLVRTGYNIQETLFDEFGNPVDRIVSGSEKEAYIRSVVLDNPRSNILFVDNQSSPLKDENIPNLSLKQYNNDRAIYTDVQTRINQELLSEKRKEFSEGVIEELGKMDRENLVQLARQSMNMVKNHIRKLEEGKGLDELSEIFRDEYGNVNVPLSQGNLVRLLEDTDTFEQGLLNFVNTIESTRLFFKSANDNGYKALRELIEEDTNDSIDKALRETAVLMRMILSWEGWIKGIQPYINDTKIMNRVIGEFRQELEKANTTLNQLAIDVLSKSLSDQWKDFNLGKKKLLEQGIISKEQYEDSIYTPQKIADWLYGKYGDARSDSSTFENPLMQSEPLIQSISRRLELSMMGGEQKNLERIVPFQQTLWDIGEKLGMSDEQIGKRLTVVDQENYWENGEMKQRPTTFILNQWQGVWMRKAKENEVQLLKDKWLEAKNSGLPFESFELEYKTKRDELNQWIQDNWYDELTPEAKNIYKHFGLEDEIFELAKERQKDIYDQMREQTNILQRFWISEQMEQEANREMERLVRELRLLRNEYDEQGNLKEGEYLLIARKLKEKSLIDRQIYNYELDKTKFLNAIKEQIVNISDENIRNILLGMIDTSNLSELYNFAKDNAPQVFVDWLDRNTRVRYSDNFYEERSEIINQIKEIVGDTEVTRTVDEIWKELTNMTSFLRDKDLTFDATDSNPVVQQRVKDYEMALESLKSEGQTNPEIIPLIQQLSEIQSKKYSDYYADVMYDKLKDYLPISSTTNYSYLVNSPEFKKDFDKLPQEFKDWFGRNHYTKLVWDEFTQSKEPKIVPTYIWNKIEPSNSKDILVIPGWKYNTRTLKESTEVEYNNEKIFVQLKTPKIDWTTWNPVERVWLPKSNQFKNPEYEKLKSSKDEKDKLLFEYLQTVTQFHMGTQNREDGVGRDSVLGFRVPYFNIKYTEGNALKTAWKSATDTLNPREQGEGGITQEKKRSVWKRLLSFSGIESPAQKEKVIRTDYLGNQFKTIYTPYTTYLNPEETTKNLPLSMANYAAGVEKVKVLKKDLPQLNLLEQVFEQFKPKQKGTLNQYGEMVDASTNNRLRLLRHIIDTKLYSNFKDFELGRGIDKFLVGVRKTAVVGSQSDLNIPNSFKNFLQGQLMNWLFIEDGGWGTRKTFYKAAASTKTSYANFIYELGKKNKSVDFHLISWFNPLLKSRTQDFSREAKGFELQDRLGYYSSSASEFSVAATLLYSHLYNQDVMIGDKKAKLYDAFTVTDGVLTIKPNTTINGQPLTLEYLQELKLRFKMMLESVQGKQWNQTIAQRFTVWQSIEFFKKFFITMFRRRFFFKRDNIVLGQTEGMYITTFKWMVRMFQGFLDGTNYNQAMTPMEKRNLIAARDEMLLAIATLFIISYLFGFDDDDEDKYKKLKDKGWLENMALLIAINTKRETDSLVPLPFISIQNSIYPPVLNETYNFITSPFVGFQVITEGRKMLDSLLLLAMGDDKAYYDRDMPAYLIEEGDSKFNHYLWKVIQLDNFLYQASPEAKIQVIIQSQNR